MANLKIINNNYSLVTLLMVFHILAIILFLNGFLSVKSTLKGFSTLEEQREKVVFRDATYNATINRVVLMVIDALRVDFVLGQNPRMKNVQDLLENRTAIAFRAKVDVPTVTLPRIKAMMTGSIPGFIDVVLNLGSTQLDEDNLLSQARLSNKNIVFYGDDTWLRLFPHHFLRSEGTTSFFVNDYTEVDNNVTNNLMKELEQQPDWDIMILHYLGLDHIGHTAGPESALIAPKLKEMDNIVKIIHDALVADEVRTGVPNLLVICGDHGMSDSGGHGGSSYSETTVPIIFSSSLAPKFISYLDKEKEEMDEIWQVDLCPTLSVLLGLPIPKNNVGKVISSLTAHLRWYERLAVYAANCHQVLNVSHHLGINTLDSRLRFAEDYHNMTFGRDFPGREYQREFDYQYYRGDFSHVSYIQRLYSNVLNDAKETISSKLVHHDVYAMLISIVIQFQVLILAVCLVARTQHTTRPNYFKLLPPISAIILYLSASVTEDNFQFQFDLRSTVLCFYLVSNIVIIKQTLYHKPVLSSSTQVPNKWIVKGLILGFTLHAFSLMASSFVEEEHQTWYFFSATVQLVVILQICQGSISKRLRLAREKFTSVGCLIVSLALLRLQRDWNHTGDKWAHLPDITDWLDGDDGKPYLTALVITSLIAIVAVFSVHESRLGIAIISVNAVVSCCHKSAIGSIKLPLDIVGSHRGITEARLVYCGIAVYVGSALFKRADRSVGRAVIVAWIQLSCLLARAQNVPLLAIMVIQERLVRKGCGQTFQVSSVVMACVYYIMAQCSYFQQGNSHSLARVDLHGGYIGLDSYVPALVAILLTCSTYAGPIFWLLSLGTAVANTRFKDDAFKVSVMVLVCRAMPWSLYAPCVLLQRFHLFVWTVFSPKLLFEGMFSLVYLFLTCGLLVTSFTLKF